MNGPGGPRNDIRVLYVDDEPRFAEMAADFLERQGDDIEVETRTSATAGLELLASNAVDCVVSDYEMPGRDGVDFLRAVREDHPDLPFVLYTGKGSEEVAGEAISAGVSDYLQKDTGTEQYELLANRIENLVSQYRAEQRAAAMRRRYEALFEGSDDAIAWVAFDGDDPIVRDANDAFEALFCADEERLIGRDLDAVVASDERAAEAKELSRKARGGETITRTLTRDTVDGPATVRAQVLPVADPDADGVTNAFVVYSTRSDAA